MKRKGRSGLLGELWASFARRAAGRGAARRTERLARMRAEQKRAEAMSRRREWRAVPGREKR